MPERKNQPPRGKKGQRLPPAYVASLPSLARRFRSEGKGPTATLTGAAGKFEKGSPAP